MSIWRKRTGCWNERTRQRNAQYKVQDVQAFVLKFIESWAWMLCVGVTLFILCWAAASLVCSETVWASEILDEKESLNSILDEENLNTDVREKQAEAQNEILEDLDLKEVEELVQQFTEDKLSFTDMIKNLMASGQALEWKTWGKVVSGVWQEAFGIQKEICIQIILLLLLTSFFANIAGAFKNPQINEMAFYMSYLMLFLVVLRQVNLFGAQIQSALEGICEFMKVLLPSYYLAIAASTGVSTAAVFYQMIMGIIYVAQKIILVVLLPCIRFYLLIALVNHLTNDEWLSRMTNLIKSAISWSLRTMLGLLMGLQLVQRLVSPAIDSLKQTILGKTAGAIPVIGDIFQGATEIVLGSAVLIKNCLGAAAIVCLLFIGAVPLIQLGVHGVLYQLIAALMQPVGENRLISCVHTMGETIWMLFRLLLTVEIMFLLTIALLAGTFF